MTRIKICGLKSLDDVVIVNEVMPEYVGVVFANSRRKVSKELALQMRVALHPKIQVVGVFVKEPIEQIIELCQEQIIDCVQLHGEETLEYVEELKRQITQPIIYAKRIAQTGLMLDGQLTNDRLHNEEMDIRKEEKVVIAEALQLENCPADYLLFDTYVKGIYGGSGKLIDYEGVPKLRKPIFLAGGLTAETVMNAIGSVKPYCVDVSSGVETDGRKDRDKILRFVDQVRSSLLNR